MDFLSLTSEIDVTVVLGVVIFPTDPRSCSLDSRRFLTFLPPFFSPWSCPLLMPLFLCLSVSTFWPWKVQRTFRNYDIAWAWLLNSLSENHCHLLRLSWSSWCRSPPWATSWVRCWCPSSTYPLLLLCKKKKVKNIFYTMSCIYSKICLYYSIKATGIFWLRSYDNNIMSPLTSNINHPDLSSRRCCDRPFFLRVSCFLPSPSSSSYF